MCRNNYSCVKSFYLTSMPRMTNKKMGIPHGFHGEFTSTSNIQKNLVRVTGCFIPFQVQFYTYFLPWFSWIWMDSLEKKFWLFSHIEKIRSPVHYLYKCWVFSNRSIFDRLLYQKLINPYTEIETTHDFFSLQRGRKTFKSKILEYKYERLAFKYFLHKLT